MEKELVKVEKTDVSIVDTVHNKIKKLIDAKDIAFPKNYNVGNALKSAYLILQSTVDSNKKPVLESCTQVSIANCLFDMAIQGLNPIKKQCYFIAYCNKLTLQRSYFGTMAIAKRLPMVKYIYADVVYEGDVFNYEIEVETGLKIISSHEQKIENIGGRILGAYCTIRTEYINYTEIMSMAQIQASWDQGQSKGNSPAHRNFPDQMAKKTVISRSLKYFVNTSNDSDCITDAFARTTDNEYIEVSHVEENQDIKEDVKKEIEEKNASKVFEVDSTSKNKTKTKAPF